jgi:hypothetical protein
LVHVGAAHHDRFALALAFRGHQELVLENLALRQQLTTLKRSVKRPPLQTRDRLFLDRSGETLAELADGVGARPAGDRAAMAS